ncbi:hypothetical protein QE379_000712 [Sphingomonas sp. SORGH_AS 879]|nr:hypothetical protein [Sphingomonas sp. SORGH_AS_0879]
MSVKLERLWIILSLAVLVFAWATRPALALARWLGLL